MRQNVSIVCLILAILSVAVLASADLSPASLSSLTELTSTCGYTDGLPESAKATPGGKLIFFLRSGPKDNLRSLYELNASTGITTKLIGPSDLGAPLLGLTSFQLSDDGKEILVPYYGKLFIVNVVDRRLLAFAGAGYLNPTLSPDGTAIAAVKNFDLITVNVSDGRVRTLTTGGRLTLTHGLSDFVDEREFGRKQGFWWSPDSRSIAYVENDSSMVAELPSLNFAHAGMSGTPIQYPYSGSPIAVVRVGIVPAQGGKTVWVTYSNKIYPYLVRVVWLQAHAPLSLVVLSRDQKSEALLAVAPQNGSSQILVKELDSDWVSVAPDEIHRTNDCSPYWLSDGSGFLWLSEDGGDWQIELRDHLGAIVREATPVGLHVRAIDDVNEQSGVITFEADSDSRQCQIYQTNFKGGVSSPVTHSIGVHHAEFSFDHLVYADTYSLQDGEQGTDVFSAVTGFRIARLPSLADSPAVLPNVRFFRVGSNQQSDAAVVFPSSLNKQGHYPVLLRESGSLGVSSVTTDVDEYLDSQWYADQGYIVICVDARGTPDRGRETEEAVKDNLLNIPIEDQVNALTELARQLPEVDLTRVGVFGEDLGGSIAVAAPIIRPYIFSCGAAISPITDWTFADSAFAERYLDLPTSDPSGYKSSSVISLASRAVRPTLILQRASFDDPTFLSSINFVEQLNKTGAPVNFVPVSPELSSPTSVDGQIFIHTRLLRFFSEELKRQ